MAVEREVSSREGEEYDAERDGRGLIQGTKLVMDQKGKYRPYFLDPANPENKAWFSESLGEKGVAGEDPWLELEYPAVGAKERFTLLEPKNSDDEYDPIEDIISSIRLILDHFLTPTQASLYFSHTPSSTNTFSAFLSAPTSRASTPVSATGGSDSPLPTATTINPLTTPLDPLIPLTPPPPFLRSLERAKLKKDGPSFLALISTFNAVLSSLKERGELLKNIKAMKGLKSVVWQKCVEQVYERSVGPDVHILKEYEPFSDNVYGELLPRFMGEIFEKTGLGPNSVFVDLGSGVGNCVLQAALATGSEAWGFENMKNAAARELRSHLPRSEPEHPTEVTSSQVATLQVQEAQRRFKMWGLSHGLMKTVLADFCTDPEVGKVLRRADVVLVNNEVFTPRLNQQLSLLFLDLPSSCRIVSLKAFASSFTLSMHNRDSPLAILDQGKELRYGRKSVSWKDEGGTYFIGRIDRGRVEKFQKKEERKRERRKERERLETGGPANGVA